MNQGGIPATQSEPTTEPAEVPTTTSAVAGSQPVSLASASSPPVSQAPPWTPPAPRTSPTLTVKASLTGPAAPTCGPGDRERDRAGGERRSREDVREIGATSSSSTPPMMGPIT